jgi:tetratricopeptide (TPR) repeat protein
VNARVVAVGGARSARQSKLSADVATEIRRSAEDATAHRREVLVEKMDDAVTDYDRGRYGDCLRHLKPLVDSTPGVPAVRELAGLAAYRAGRWRESARHFAAYRDLTGDAEHIAAEMDCARALGQYRKVSKFWNELRHGTPSPETMAEARIVAASTLADRGDLTGAISLLATAGAAKSLRNPAERHIRQWYVLADLYERAGDVPRSRDLFERVRRADPGAYDVAERLDALGRGRRPAAARRSRPAASKRTGSAAVAKTVRAPGNEE